MTLKIWSLSDIMRQFNAWNFAYTVHELAKFSGLSHLHDAASEVDTSLLAEISFLIAQLERHTHRLQLKATNRRVRRELRISVGGKAYGPLTWGRLRDELQVVWEIMGPEMAGRRFACIESAKDEYLCEMLGDPSDVSNTDRRDPSPLWLNIWKMFPIAKTECEEAIYCYALERNTACVFHSMRVAEIGLRALARRMKVKLPKNKKLEWAQCQEVLREMSNKTDTIARTAKAGPAKDELLEFYNGAIGQFYGFKDEFRNQVMHLRKAYDEFEAASAVTRVRDFMGKLSRRINEKGAIVKKADWLSEWLDD